MSRIITIGREFGSGGRELGRRLAEKLGYVYYDQEIVTQIAQRRFNAGCLDWAFLNCSIGQ